SSASSPTRPASRLVRCSCCGSPSRLCCSACCWRSRPVCARPPRTLRPRAPRPGHPQPSAVSAPPAGTSRVRLVVTALGLGAVGYATQATLYFSALQRIDASLVALVLYTSPPLVTVAAAALGRDALTPGRLAALVVASAGT